MAKLMVMIDLPEHDYELLGEAMEKHTQAGDIDFGVIKSLDGIAQVAVPYAYIPAHYLIEKYIFELIGVRP